MRADLVRAKAPTGEDRTFTLRMFAPLFVVAGEPPEHIDRFVRATVVEHGRDGVYVGVHPNLLFFPYVEIEKVE